jgi:hypothetical protein
MRSPVVRSMSIFRASRGEEGGDLAREVDELVGIVAHGADANNEVVAGGARGDDAFDALGPSDGGFGRLLHDEADLVILVMDVGGRFLQAGGPSEGCDEG